MGDTGARRRLALGAALLVLLGGAAGPSTTLAGGSAISPGTASGSSLVLAPLASGTYAGSSASRATARSATATPTTGRWSGSVNVNSQAAVNAAYLRDFRSGLSVPTGWRGSDSSCQAGSQTPGSRAATLRALNFTRSLAGLAPVTFSADLNSRSQLTALLMSANRSLSHAPPKSWRCYTATGGANAGKANLALSYPSISSAGVVAQYLEDAGASNRAAGHRRWLLNPFATTMGSGATNTANAITVIGPTATSRPNPAVVSWPTAGYFPSTLEPAGRWSLSLGNRALSFRWATVRVWRDGKLITATKQPVADGYAQPTLVWQIPANLARTGTFKVEVKSIRTSAKGTAYTRSYTVKMFTPTS